MYWGIDCVNGLEHPAVIMADSGDVVTYGELDERSNRVAQLLWETGLRTGDHIAIFAENHPRYFEIVWAALRSGLFYTPINFHLTAPEVAYIASDCGARVFFTSTAQAGVASLLVDSMPNVERRLMIDSAPLGADHADRVAAGYECYEESIGRVPAAPLAREIEGAPMMYSSGTTGQPKGILPPLPDIEPGDAHPLKQPGGGMWQFDGDSIYLSPAPLYHAAPIVTCTIVHRYGATVVVTERFDAEGSLRAIQKYHCTHAQLVPTMFVRMLKLPEETRAAYDVSSLKIAVHAAAPCPVEIKRQMIDWWGPVIHEYYSGSENIGFTHVEPEEWLAHPGTVGQSKMGVIHILDDDGTELPSGEPGQIWFENDLPGFVYHNDPEKSSNARNDRGWWTLGDIGRLDDEGYLYLTDRKAYMIISGGVNIYPQEAENALTTHPKVYDVAVIGVPDAEMGEQVKAVVQPMDMSEAGPALEAELIAFCRENLAHYKCPRSIDFESALPRQDTGKLYKRLIKDRYWGERAERI